MKKCFHSSYSSHGEVLFRSPEDHRAFVNLLALQVYRHDVELLADAEMSNHVHLTFFAEDPVRTCAALRHSYTIYFNRRHHREGRLGDKGIFVRQLEGFCQIGTAISYTLRNGLHHGQAATAFGYRYSSVNELFAEDRGIVLAASAIFDRREILSHLPRHAEFPDSYQMGADGVFLRQSFMEIRKAESYYGTARNFLFQMNRITDERWIQEQKQNGQGAPPVLLQDIEPSVDPLSYPELLRNEKGRRFNPSHLDDLALCRIIDQELVPAAGYTSIYEVPPATRQRFCMQLRHDYRLPEVQLRRCLIL